MRPKGKPVSISEMIKQVRQAQREWEAAKQYFQAVSEPDRVDHAIFSLQAAERRYMFLLNEVKERTKLGGEGYWN